MRFPSSWRWIGRVAVALVALAFLPGHAEPGAGPPWDAAGDVHFQVIAAASGLPTLGRGKIAQDGRGRIWMGSNSGLVRWDGYRAQVYHGDADDPHAPPPGMSSGAEVDADGRVWMGTSSGIVARYDPDTDRFDRWTISMPGRSVAVQAIAQEAPGRYLVATQQGVFRLEDPAPGRPGRWSSVEGLRPQIVNSLLVDADGQAWAGAHDGLYLKRRASDRFERVPLPGAPRPWVVLQSDGPHLWASSSSDVFVIDRHALAAREVAGLRPGPAFTSLVRVDETHLWLGSNRGVAVLDEASGQVRWIRHDPRRADSLPDDYVVSLLRDRSGLVWAATDNGAGVYDPSRRGVATMSSAGNVPVLLDLGGGRILVSNSTDLRVLAAADGTTRPFVADPAAMAAMATIGEIVGLARLRDGSVLVAAQEALLHLDAQGRLLSRDDRLRSIYSMRAEPGRIWIGTTQNGLWTVDTARPDQLVRVDRAQDGLQADLPGPRFEGRRLVASDVDLWLVDEVSGTLQALQPERPQDRLQQGRIVTMVPDRQGRVWIGTLGAGLCVLMPGDVPGRFRSRQFTVKDGLPSDNVTAILFDRQGTAWLSADGGLVGVDPDSFVMRVLDRRQDAVFDGYWPDAASLADDGTLWFGSHQGVAALRPERLRSWSERPPTVISSVRVGNGPRERIAPAAGLTVPADAQKFALEFSALDYSAPEFNRYRYRLEGVDDHWIDTDAAYRRADYTHLAPGRYVLHLQGSNRDGAWGAALDLPVRVLPAWHQTWWFKALAGVAAAGLAVLAYATLTARLRRQRAALERAVQRRTREVVRQKEEVQRQKEIVDQKASELEAVNRQLAHMSMTDALTGLHNRRYLTHDLDHFKQVNDVHGHAAGDAVLRQVAERLRSVARESDRLVRWGGEEFLLVARDATLGEAGAIAERLCAAMRAAPFDMAPGIRVPKTCSVGFAALPFFESSPKGVGWLDGVAVADHALYMAKTAGRDGWVGLAAGPALAPDVPALLAAIGDTDGALADGRLVRECRRGTTSASDAAASS